MIKSRRIHLKKALMGLGTAVVLGGVAANPAAASHNPCHPAAQASSSVAGNPCAARNSSAVRSSFVASNPCAAKNPCAAANRRAVSKWSGLNNPAFRPNPSEPDM